MEMTGEYRISAPRSVVWAALNDVEVLKAAIPGCDSITRLSDTNIEATVVAKVGPVSATFKGAVTLSDLDPPNGYTISGEGKGGVAGFGKGSARVRLVDDGDGTVLSYQVTASVGGKLAQIGSRLIDVTAKKLADDFFARFGVLAAAYAPAAAPTQPPPPVTPPPVSATVPPAPATGPLRQGVGFAGIYAIIGALEALLILAMLLIAA